jgi:hypothetical protein
MAIHSHIEASINIDKIGQKPAGNESNTSISLKLKIFSKFKQRLKRPASE